MEMKMDINSISREDQATPATNEGRHAPAMKKPRYAPTFMKIARLERLDDATLIDKAAEALNTLMWHATELRAPGDRSLRSDIASITDRFLCALAEAGEAKLYRVGPRLRSDTMICARCGEVSWGHEADCRACGGAALYTGEVTSRMFIVERGAFRFHTVSLPSTFETAIVDVDEMYQPTREFRRPTAPVSDVDSLLLTVETAERTLQRLAEGAPSRQAEDRDNGPHTAGVDAEAVHAAENFAAYQIESDWRSENGTPVVIGVLGKSISAKRAWALVEADRLSCWDPKDNDGIDDAEGDFLYGAPPHRDHMVVRLDPDGEPIWPAAGERPVPVPEIEFDYMLEVCGIKRRVLALGNIDDIFFFLDELWAAGIAVVSYYDDTRDSTTDEQDAAEIARRMEHHACDSVMRISKDRLHVKGVTRVRYRAAPESGTGSGVAVSDGNQIVEGQWHF
jgi:hypothetical protein